MRYLRAVPGALGFLWTLPNTVLGLALGALYRRHPVFAEEMVRRGAARSGLTWHFARPPVVDLEYEMDCRRVMREVVI